MALKPSHRHHNAPDVGFVAGVDGVFRAAPRAGAAPVALDEEPDDGLPAAPGSDRRRCVLLTSKITQGTMNQKVNNHI